MFTISCLLFCPASPKRICSYRKFFFSFIEDQSLSFKKKTTTKKKNKKKKTTNKQKTNTFLGRRQNIPRQLPPLKLNLLPLIPLKYSDPVTWVRPIHRVAYKNDYSSYFFISLPWWQISCVGLWLHTFWNHLGCVKRKNALNLRNMRRFKFITKTRLFKYIENFTSKNRKFSGKNSDIFHISAQNIDCGYSLEPPRRGGSNEYPQSMFLSRNKKNNVYPCKPQFYYK